MANEMVVDGRLVNFAAEGEGRGRVLRVYLLHVARMKQGSEYVDGEATRFEVQFRGKPAADLERALQNWNPQNKLRVEGQLAEARLTPDGHPYLFMLGRHASQPLTPSNANELRLTGYPADEPVMENSEPGKERAKMPMKHSVRESNGRGEMHDAFTARVRVTAWGRQAVNLVQSVKKTSADKLPEVTIVGRPQVHAYDIDGTTKVSIDMSPEEIEIPIARQVVRGIERSSGQTAARDSGRSGPSGPQLA